MASLPPNLESITADALLAWLLEVDPDMMALATPEQQREIVENILAEPLAERKATLKLFTGVKGRTIKEPVADAVAGAEAAIQTRNPNIKGLTPESSKVSPLRTQIMRNPESVASALSESRRPGITRPTRQTSISSFGPESPKPTLSRNILGRLGAGAGAETAAIEEELLTGAPKKGFGGKAGLAVAALTLLPLIVAGGTEGARKKKVKQAIGSPTSQDYLRQLEDQANMAKMQQLMAKHDPTLLQGLLNMAAGVPPRGFDLTDSEVRIGKSARQASAEEVDPQTLMSMMQQLEK